MTVLQGGVVSGANGINCQEARVAAAGSLPGRAPPCATSPALAAGSSTAHVHTSQQHQREGALQLPMLILVGPLPVCLLLLMLLLGRLLLPQLLMRLLHQRWRLLQRRLCRRRRPLLQRPLPHRQCWRRRLACILDFTGRRGDHLVLHYTGGRCSRRCCWCSKLVQVRNATWLAVFSWLYPFLLTLAWLQSFLFWLTRCRSGHCCRLPIPLGACRRSLLLLLLLLSRILHQGCCWLWWWHLCRILHGPLIPRRTRQARLLHLPCHHHHLLLLESSSRWCTQHLFLVRDWRSAQHTLFLHSLSGSFQHTSISLVFTPKPRQRLLLLLLLLPPQAVLWQLRACWDIGKLLLPSMQPLRLIRQPCSWLLTSAGIGWWLMHRLWGGWHRLRRRLRW